MVGLDNTEFRKASALIEALSEEEITILEFRDAIAFLGSEALQVASCILGVRAASDPSHATRLGPAHRMCSQLAASTRILC